MISLVSGVETDADAGADVPAEAIRISCMVVSTQLELVSTLIRTLLEEFA